MPDRPDDPTDPTDPTDESRSQLSRRRLLGAAAAGASALALSATRVGRAAAAGRPVIHPDVPVRGVPADPADSGIEHVVVVCMENRSFDHMLGWMPRTDGRQAGLSFTDTGGVAHPTWHLDTFQGLEFHDPDHSFTGGRTELNGGACDGWLRAGHNDVYSIGYYTRDDLAFYGHAALYWTVCDRYFAPFLGPTYPNRFYLHSAQTDRLDNAILVNGAFTTMPTIWDSLAAAGVSAKYYYSDVPFTALWGGPLAGISHPVADFEADAAAGTLPAVSYLDPRFSGEGDGTGSDDHPHSDIRAGQAFLNHVYETVSSSPNWESTVLVITYDEWGGFFDHIVPPTAPDANPAWTQRGFRVPTFLISPFARRGHVEHRWYDHTSILKMIEWRWGLPALTPRDAAARNLAEALDFRHAPDLTAPRWPVPAPPAPGAAAPSSRAMLAGATAAAEVASHTEEWNALGQVASEHGFGV